MAQLDDKTKKRIRAHYVQCENMSETARKFNVSVPTVKRHVRDEKTLKRFKDKKEQNSLEVMKEMELENKTVISILKKSLKRMNETIGEASLRDANNTYGILWDKEMKKIDTKNNKKLTIEVNQNPVYEELMGLIKNDTK